MSSIRNPKPLVSTLLALLLVVAIVAPFLQVDALGMKNPNTPFDDLQAGAIRWLVIGGLALLWLGIQLFWKAPAEATKLGMAASATVFWLCLTLFFNFTEEGIGGAVAFFALVGGLGVVLIWTRFLSDELSY
jgi:hypothetical protein